MVALGKYVPWQHIVGQHRSRGHKNLVGNNQFLIHQTLQDLMLIGVAQQRVITQRDEGFYRIGVAVGHSSEYTGWVCHLAPHNQVCVGETPNSFRGLF